MFYELSLYGGKRGNGIKEEKKLGKEREIARSSYMYKLFGCFLTLFLNLIVSKNSFLYLES